MENETMKKRNFVNIDERYGGQENCCIDDYRELNPDCDFEEREDGIYEGAVKVAEPAPRPAAALGKIGGASRSEAKQNASRNNGKKGGRPAKK